ncbi:MAG: hypothetical protein IJB79_08545 [Candidatus Gastranaerophilales bacterium]|nr:hypothetical protein [Candidatus Gastranaerophilales bacterium]
MKLIDIYKNSYKMVISTPAVTMFLVLFLIVSNLLTSYAFSSGVKSLALILTFCVFMLTLCFISGWLYIIKDTIKNDKKEDKNYWAIFLEGIGKNIVSIFFGFIIYFILFLIILILTGKVAYTLFGNLDFLTKDATLVAQSNQAFLEYVNKLPENQQFAFLAWQLSFILSTTVYSFLMLFYYPSIINNEKSNIFLKPIVALKDSICFLFKNFFGALAIHFSILVIYFIFNSISLFFESNPIVSILLIFFYIYFISSAIMLIFNYYEQRNNCVDGCDCIGENEDIDKSCEEL